MSQIKLEHQISKHSRMFNVATQGYLNLLKEISAASDDPGLKHDIDQFIHHLKNAIKNEIQPSHQPISPAEKQNASSPILTHSPLSSLADVLKATGLVTLEGPYHEARLADAWRSVYLCALHYTPSHKKNILAPLQPFQATGQEQVQTTGQEQEVVIFADRNQVIVPGLAVNGKLISGAVRLSIDREAQSVINRDHNLGGASAKMIGMINTIYYLYDNTPHLLSAYQAITPRGYEKFTATLVEQWQISVSHILEKFTSKTAFMIEDSKLLVDLDEAISSIFPGHTTPHTHSWFEGLLAQFRYEMSNILRSIGIRRFNWNFGTLASASSETNNNLLYQEPTLEPGTVVRVLRASVEFPHIGSREGRVLYSNR